MKGLLLACLFAGLIIGPTPIVGEMCIGAQAAAFQVYMAAQERSTPPGEWCQRPTTRMSPKAHSCDCHKHDCTKDDRDPDNLSAHTDAKMPQLLHDGELPLCRHGL